MKRTKSKLNLVELQKQFDAILDDFDVKNIVKWKVRDTQIKELKIPTKIYIAQ